MTLSGIGAVRIAQLIVPSTRLADQQSEDASGSEALSGPKAGDDVPLSLAQTPDSQIVGRSRSLAVLKYRSDLNVKQTGNGELTIKFKSRLNFNYEFKSDDGTTIRIAAKLKTQIFYKETSDGSYELKARVKFQFSMLQKTVASGLAPVLDSGDVSDGQKSAISSAQLDFGEVANQLAKEFLGDTLFGDDLITDVVSAFNRLTRSVQAELPPKESQQESPKETELPVVSAEQPLLNLSSELAEDPLLLVVVTDQVALPVETGAVEDQLPSEPGEVPNADQPAVQPVGDDGTSVSGDAVKSETDVPPATIASLADPETPAMTRSFSERSVFVELRVKIVQSLTQLVSVLDSPSDGGDTSIGSVNIRSHTKLDFRLAVYSQRQTLIGNLSGINVDANA